MPIPQLVSQAPCQIPVTTVGGGVGVRVGVGLAVEVAVAVNVAVGIEVAVAAGGGGIVADGCSASVPLIEGSVGVTSASRVAVPEAEP